MAYFEIRISKDDVDGDDKPEVFVEFYYQKDTPVDTLPNPELKSASVIYSSKANGVYDTVSDKADLDGSENHDEADTKILLDLANAFAKVSSKSFEG